MDVSFPRSHRKEENVVPSSHTLTFHRALHRISHKRYGDEQCNDFLGWSGKEQEQSAQPEVLIHDFVRLYVV